MTSKLIYGDQIEELDKIFLKDKFYFPMNTSRSNV